MLKRITPNVGIRPLMNIKTIENTKNSTRKRSRGEISMWISIIIWWENLYELLTINKNSLEYQKRIIIEWLYKIDIGLDGINIIIITLTTMIIPLTILFKPEKREKIYYDLIIGIELILILMVITKDLILFYTMYELILIPMFILIVRYGSKNKRIEAGYKLLIFTLFGSLLMLISIIYIYNKYGTLNNEIIEIKIETEKEYIKKWLWISFIISFMIKIPTLPFHIWLPFAHVQAPTIASVILASILLKIGAYGIIRINITDLNNINTYYSPIIITLSIISIYKGIMLAIRQIDLKIIIAYSSIIHMNIYLIGIIINENIAMMGSLISLISHGLISGSMFFLIGIIYNRYHTRIISYYRGLSNVMPMYSIFFMLNIIGNIAIPLTSSFVGEYLIIYGVMNKNIIIGTIIVISIIISGSYSIWLNNRVIYGSLSKNISKSNDITKYEFWILLILTFFVYLIGINPNPFLNYLYLISLYLS